METINKKTWVIIISAIAIAIIILLFWIHAVLGHNNVKAAITSSSQNSDSNPVSSNITVMVPEVSESQSSSNSTSSTTISVDVTQSSVSNSSSKPTASKISPSSSKPSSSSSGTGSKTSSVTSSTVTSSAPYIPSVPTSQEVVTKKVANNTILLNVNAFTFEAFVDWSDVQDYLLDDFYVNVYKNGVLKTGPNLCGCVATDPTNTVTVNIDTYKASDGNWYIEPATYTIECYCQLGVHSLVTENRPNIIHCPSASFTVSIYERGFK